ncbi:MAG: LysR family transcriptional regulator [Butyrivibrio sp.]|nr:LysR family transcriptional regulator [Butyrivibrio sp.]
MTLQQIYYAITISDTGSMNKAAEILYVAQPSLSGAIHDLESELGITIFHRSGRGVTLTNDGVEFLTYARQVYSQYEALRDKYGDSDRRKKKFGVSTQHYSFAVKSFVEMVKQFDTEEYEFAIRETKTKEVVEDVSTLKSEIGILYLSNFNQAAISKILKAHDLEFHKLIDCRVYAYLWKGHPLANESSVKIEKLYEYPCLTFEQGESSSFYFAEEIFSTNEYPRTIKANDRATMLNLMVGLNGYTLCSGIICEELNGGDYIAVPLDSGEDSAENGHMQIGYIVKKNQILSSMGSLYIKETEKYLQNLIKSNGASA